MSPLWASGTRWQEEVMADQQYQIALDDVDGRETLTFTSDDDQLRDILRRGGPQPRFSLRLSEESDTEGHGATSVLSIAAVLTDDDTEGHAISLRFPSREEADAFRRRLLAAGVLVGAVTVSGVGAAALTSQAPSDASGAASTVVTQTDANRDVGIMDRAAAGAGAAAAPTAADSDRDVGIMDRAAAASSSAEDEASPSRGPGQMRPE
jgi:hypothetical protein